LLIVALLLHLDAGHHIPKHDASFSLLSPAGGRKAGRGESGR
jgi:hypothetical protein